MDYNPDTMVLITSDCDAMRSPGRHQVDGHGLFGGAVALGKALTLPSAATDFCVEDTAFAVCCH